MLYHKYKIYCTTEQAWKYWILPEGEPVPTTCPDDTNHQVDLNSISIESTFDPDPKTVTISETPPFAVPTFRTKWNAASDIVTVNENSEAVIDLTTVDEIYCHGGEVLFEDVKFGDWIEAFIIDDELNPVIPEPYRETLAEAWPIIATYIIKFYMSSGSGLKTINTYPLNAKITQGLKLRLKIHTCSEVGTRKFAANYFLTKKL